MTRLTSQFKQLEQARQRDLKAARKTMRVEMNKLDKAASRAMVDLNRIDMQIKVRVVLRSLVLPHAHTRARACAWLCGCVCLGVQTAQADRRSTELQLGETGEKIRRLPNTSAARDKLAVRCSQRPCVCAELTRRRLHAAGLGNTHRPQKRGAQVFEDAASCGECGAQTGEADSPNAQDSWRTRQPTICFSRTPFVHGVRPGARC